MFDVPSMQIPMVPVLDIPALNIMLKNLKKALGPLGKDITLLDAKTINAELDKVKKELTSIDRDFQKTFKAGDTNAMQAELEGLLKKLQKVNDEQERKPKKSTNEGLADELTAAQAELEDLISMQEKAAAAMKLAGKAGTTEYKELRAELVKNQAELKKIDDAMDEVRSGSDNESFADKYFKGEALLKAGEALSAFDEKQKATRKELRGLKGDVNLAGGDFNALKEAAGDVFVGGGFEETTDAVHGIRVAYQQLGQTLKATDLKDLTQISAGTSDRTGKELDEVIAKSRTTVEAFKLSGKEGGNFIAYLSTQAGSAMDDALDTADEYAQLMPGIGLGIEEWTGLLVRGVKAGARDTDKLADALKETQIRLKAGDVTNALKDIQSPVTETIQGIVSAAEAGDISIKDMIFKVSQATEEAFKAGTINEQIRSQIQVAVSGTPAEDLGSDLYAKIFSAPIDTAAIRRQAEQAGEQMKKNIAPGNIFEEFELQAKRALGGLGDFLGPALGPAAQFATITGQFGPAMEAMKVGDRIKDMKGWASSVIDAAKNLFTSTTATAAQTTATGAQTVATVGSTVATRALSVAMYAMPILALVGGVLLLINALGGFSASTEELIEDMDKAGEATSTAIKNAQTAIADTTAIDKQQQKIKGLADEHDKLSTDKSVEGQKRFIEVSKELAAEVPASTQGLKDENEQFRINTDVVRAYADSKLAANEAIRQGQLAEVTLRMKELAESTDDARERQEDLQAEYTRLQKLVADGGGKVAVANDGLFGTKDAQTRLLEVQQEMGNLQTSIETNNEEWKNGVKLLESQGKSTAQIAQETDRTVEEVEKVKQEMKIAEEAAKKTAQAQGDVAAGADKAAASQKKHTDSAKLGELAVKRIADAYDKVKQKADDSYDLSFKGVLGIREQSRQFTREIALLQKELETLGDVSVLDLDKLLRKGQIEGQIAAKREQIALLKEQEKAEIEAAKTALLEVKRLERESQRLQLQVGAIDFNVTDFTDQAETIEQELRDIGFAIAQESITDELAKKVNEINNNYDQAIAETKKAVTDLDKQLTALRSDDDLSNDQVKGFDRLRSALANKAVALEKQRQFDLARAAFEAQSKQIEDLRAFLGNRQRLLDSDFDRRLAELRRQEASIDASTEEGIIDRLRTQTEIIQVERGKQINALLFGNDLYVRALGDVESAENDLADATAKGDAAKAASARTALQTAQTSLREVRRAITTNDTTLLDALIGNDAQLKTMGDSIVAKQAELAAAKDDIDKARLQSELTSLTQQRDSYVTWLSDQKELTADAAQQLVAINADASAKITAAETTNGTEIYNVRAALVEREIELEQRKADRIAAIIRQASEGIVAGLNTALTAKVDQELNNALARLESQQEQELLSEEAFEAKKLKLEEDAEKKRTALKAQEEGARLVIEQEAAIESLRFQEQLLERKKALAESLGQTEAAKGLELELAGIQDQLGQKGNAIVDMLEQTSGQLGQAAGSLFTGQGEVTKQGFREYFGTLAGGLQRMAAAKITELILSSIGLTGIPGLIAAIALKPLLSSILGALLNPILADLLSFPTGGRFDQPTPALIGDGAKLGGTNREWLFRDDQLRLLLAGAVRAANEGMIEYLDLIYGAVSTWPTQLTAKGRDLVLVAGREQSAQKRRAPAAVARRIAA